MAINNINLMHQVGSVSLTEIIMPALLAELVGKKQPSLKVDKVLTDDEINKIQVFDPTDTSELVFPETETSISMSKTTLQLAKMITGTKTNTIVPIQISLSTKNDVPKSEEQELAEILIKYSPKDPKVPGDKTIYNAAKAGDERAVKLLIKYKADQGANKSITLDCAIMSKSLPLVKYLAEEENYFSGKELIQSVRYDFFDGFDYFRSKGFELPKDIIVRSIYGCNKYFLDMWGVGSDMGRVNFLLSRGADLACIQDSPGLLNSAINADDLELMKFLLQSGAYVKVNECSWEAHPLLCAFSGGFLNLGIDKKVEYARLLLDSGMKIDSKFSKQIWAEFLKLTTKNNGGINSQKTELLKSLIRAGLLLSDYPSSQKSALQYAIQEFKDYDLVEFMLKMGCDPNYKIYLETPLQTAIKLGNDKIIALLIKYGAKLDSV